MTTEDTIYSANSLDEEQMRSQSQYSHNLQPEWQISLRNSNIESLNLPTSSQTNIIDPNSDSGKEEKFLCVLWKSGKLGAAYFDSSDSELYVVSDILDLNPDFMMMKTLYNQVKPTHTITIGTFSSQFVQAVSNIAQNNGIEQSEFSSSSDSANKLPPNVQLLKNDEYSFELASHAIKTLKLPTEPDQATEIERLTHISMFVNFDQKVSVHALGTLILFLTKFRGLIQINTNTPQKDIFLNINTISIQDIVLMDQDTFRALQIFQILEHPAEYKRGQISGNKEGLSIFQLFNRCKSSLGRINLRSILLHPTNDIKILKKRQEFIEFCLKPVNNGIVKGIQDCLKNIFPLGTALRKIQWNQATLNNWKTLYSTLQNIYLIYELCVPYLNEVALFQELANYFHDNICLIIQTIANTIDFDSKDGKITIKLGVDEELDAKKRFREQLSERITLAASYEINKLPPYVNNCSMIYIPQIGYLVTIQKWRQNANPKDLEIYGYRHMFTLADTFNFKSSVTDELDNCLGDISTEINEHESRLILRLTQNVMARNFAIKKPLNLIAHFDSLICMADVAKGLGYVCPNLVVQNIIDIEEGRHPLLDLYRTNFVANNFQSGGNFSHLKIITGPNNSGKSIYLKQTALIVYLAHIGSFVPAKSATIGMMTSIHSNIPTFESAAIRMSAFAIDLRQIFQAANCSNKNSLIVIDEFGRATTELDGLSLLASYLVQFLIREENCPHIILSTHYLHVTRLLPESPLVEHLKCLHKLDDDRIVFLYKIVKGISNSFAAEAALCAGFSQKFVQRSREILKCYEEGKPIPPLKNN